MLQIFQGERIRDQWPSLLIGGVGTGSVLHVDEYQTSFWLYMAAGYKQWHVYDRNVQPLLYPNAFTAVFGFDSLNPNYTKHPLANHAWKYSFSLKPGDMVLLPHGFPHAVENLSAETIALAGNYVNDINWNAMIQELQRRRDEQPSGGGESEASRLLRAIQDSGFKPAPSAFLQTEVTYEAFKQARTRTGHTTKTD